MPEAEEGHIVIDFSLVFYLAFVSPLQLF